MTHSPKIQVKQSPLEGFGVFATEDISAGEILEEVPFILIEPIIDSANKLQEYLDNAGLLSDELKVKDNLRLNLGFKSVAKYIFKYIPPFPDFNGKVISYCVLPLGFGCIYNSANGHNNAEWTIKDKTFTFKASEDIKAGQEIRTFYGYFLSEDGQDWNIDITYNLGLEQKDGRIVLDALKFSTMEAKVAAEKHQGYSKILSIFKAASEVRLLRGFTVNDKMEQTSSIAKFQNLAKLSSYYSVLKKFKETGRTFCLELGFDILGKECKETIIL